MNTNSMSFESPSSSALFQPESESESMLEPTSLYPDVSLADLHKIAGNDKELDSILEEVEKNITRYIRKREEHVAWSENQTAKHRDGYESKAAEKEKSRYETHNELINTLKEFAEDLKLKGENTDWWDGPGGIYRDWQKQTARQRVDMWAQDVWVEELSDQEE